MIIWLFYNPVFVSRVGLGWVGWPLEDTLPKTMSSVNLLGFPSDGRANKQLIARGLSAESLQYNSVL